MIPQVTVQPLPPEEQKVRRKLDNPGLDKSVTTLSPSRRPFVAANGWQFIREPGARYWYDVPAGAGPLAAAEAHAYGVDATVKIDARDKEAVGKVLAFVRTVPEAKLPVLAQIGVVDDGSEAVGEVMMLLSRRNLLWTVVKAPDPKLALTIRLGSSEFPKESAKDPSEFAYRVRKRISDGKRLLRVFGSEVVLARVVGEGKRARVSLLNYGGGVADGIRIRVRGAYPTASALPDRSHLEPVIDHRAVAGFTELTVPPFTLYAVVDLSSS